MKLQESQGEANSRIIDVAHRLGELRTVRAELASLRTELFEACCSFQHDPTSVEPTRLSALAIHLRAVEERSASLESSIAVLLAARERE